MSTTETWTIQGELTPEQEHDLLVMLDKVATSWTYDTRTHRLRAVELPLWESFCFALYRHKLLHPEDES